MNYKELVKLLKKDGWVEKKPKRKSFAIYTSAKAG
jgi:predicted RNA binding protein YcfA (HicA-like mRNA interferase family)